ncbi:MAG: hypothetical protein JNN20_01225 [Betaproteobacteria bacterium]|nr:hypothetical protein [Betaproteobacteria bacterium]
MQASDQAVREISPSDERERRAFNRAFRELAFTWYWDTSTFRGLLPIADTRERLRYFLETERPTVLSAYPIDFLVNLVCETQRRLLNESMDSQPAAFSPQRGWTAGMHSTESIA